MCQHICHYHHSSRLFYKFGYILQEAVHQLGWLGALKLQSKNQNAADEIEDALYYFSNAILSGVPDLRRLITGNTLLLLVFPILLPSLKREFSDVFVPSHQIQNFCAGENLPDQPLLCFSLELTGNSRAKGAALDVFGPKRGTELNPTVDNRHPKWLHLRIHPSTLAFTNSSMSYSFGKGKSNALVDGRWTLAFRDEQCCKSAESIILEEMHIQSTEVKKRLCPVL